jgi:UPF0755 protein
MIPFLERFSVAAGTALQSHVARFRDRYVAALGTVVLLVVLYASFLSAPRFPGETVAVVAEGANAAQVAQDLADARLVRSPALLRLYWKLAGEGNSLHAGAYRFARPESFFRVAARIADGEYGIAPVRITLFEGDTARNMANRIAAALPEVATSTFISAAQPYEGYLFPDTYVFPPSATADSIVAVMRQEFSEKTAPLLPEIEASGHSLADIVIMASLLEREARTPEEKRMVAGVLWNRIRKGMPLQVDAVFGYIFGRNTYSPSFEDLNVDSPYNTYLHAGLPPGPIANPGLDSIEAAMHPAKTAFLYYLTGKDGQMRYAATYDAQLANQRRYLR